MVKVEHSAMIRRGRPAAAISFAVAISASGFGRLVMMIGRGRGDRLGAAHDLDAGLGQFLALAPASMSKPITRHPALTRLRENEPPMMPSPITPTVLLVFAGLIPSSSVDFVLAPANTSA